MAENNAQAVRQLREAIAILRAESDFLWLVEIAHAVVEHGGGDAVDLLHMNLDEALADYAPGDPAEN